jgi:hypothetical protein
MASSSNWEEQGINFKIITKEQVYILYIVQFSTVLYILFFKCIADIVLLNILIIATPTGEKSH